MMQFYFLSILLNGIVGYLLVSENSLEDQIDDGEIGGNAGPSSIPGFFKNETFRLILGVLAMVTGLLKLLSATNGDLPVLGDIIPALVGFASGFTLILEFYHGRTTVEEGGASFTLFLINHRRWVGFAAIAAAALHFLFPGVLLL
jgi:hypothetical protein